jgi:hypothetical protein
MKTLLDLEEMICYFLFERSFPGNEIRNLAVEDQCFSLIPDAPSSNHENFHEKRMREIPFSPDQLPMNIQSFFPGDP